MIAKDSPLVSDPGPKARIRAVPLRGLLKSVMGSKAPSKQSHLIADDLQEELLRQGWPTGLRFGGEAALARRYGVGRDVVREVIRVLQTRDQAKMRRGPLGGLEIIRPELPELTARLVGYAYITQLHRANMIETWTTLQGVAVRVLAGRDEFDWQALAGSLADCEALSARGFAQTLIALSDSKVLRTLGDLLAALLPDFVDAPLPPEVAEALSRTTTADGLLHTLRMVVMPHLILQLDQFPAEQYIGPPEASQSSRFKSQAMELVHYLMSAATPSSWASGQLLGNEFDLIDRFGVDKSVVRQAIRLMEDAEAAISLPGRGRGLITRLPSTGPISSLLGTYFMAHESDIADAEAVFDALSLERAGAAADNASDDDKARMSAMIHNMEGMVVPLPIAALQKFERCQQQAAHNCLLGLFIDAVTAFLTWRLASSTITSQTILDVYLSHTKKVVTAICGGHRQEAITAEARKLADLSIRLRRDARDFYNGSMT